MIRNRDILILFIVAFISTGIALSFRNDTHVVTTQSIQLLTENSSLHFDAIRTITLQKEGELLKFELYDNEWWQVLPFQLRMDSPSMFALIRAVQGVRLLGELSETTKLSVVGLGQEASTISLSDGSETITIRLGRKTLGGRAYAQIGESLPVVVDQSLHRRFLDVNHTLWRDVHLFPDFAIDGIRIERVVNEDRLLLVRTSGRWEMLEPVSARVDQEFLLEWVGRIAAARVNTFVIDEPHDLALFGLHEPVAIFTVSNRNGTSHQLFVGGRVSAGSQDRYVMFAERPVVCKVKWEILSTLFPSAEIFVDATGSAVSRFDIKQVTVRMGGNEKIFVRDLERWVDANGVQADNEAIEALLTWILTTRPPSVSIGQYPIQDEIATIVVSGYDLMPLDTVRIALQEDGLWILENGDNVLRIHPEEAGEVLEPFAK